MYYDEIREKAEKRVQNKKGFYVVTATFISVSIILYVLSLFFHGSIVFWLRFPILVLVLVLGILYVSIFGLPFSSNWEEEEIEKEITKELRRNPPALPPEEELSEDDKLELKELERLKKKWDPYDDYV